MITGRTASPVRGSRLPNAKGIEVLPLRMLRRSRAMLAIGTAAGAAFFAGGGCGEPTGPLGKPIAIAAGDTISGEFHSGDTIRVYTFSVHADNYFAVFLQALSGAVGVRVGYAGFTSPLQTVLASPGFSLDQLATDVFLAHVDGTMEVHVFKSVAGGPDAKFRFLVAHIDPSPEIHASQIHLGDTVSGETLQSIADLDRFTFPGQAGQVVVALLQAQGPAGSGTIRLDVRAPDGNAQASATSIGGDSSLDDQVSGPFVLPLSGTYQVDVRSIRGVNVEQENYQGPYRLWVTALDSAPELGPVQVTIGDTVTEAISPIGDVDEFTFNGSAGQEFNLFFQALSGRAKDYLHATIPGVATTWSIGSDTSLLRQATSRFALPSTGVFKILVYGDDNELGGDRGRYRFFLYPVNRRPESSPDTITLDDSVLGERIEFPGDVDEFHVVVPDSSGATLLVQLGAGATGGGAIEASLLDTAGHLITAASSDTVGKFSQTSTEVGPGMYTVRAEAVGAAGYDVNALRGSYRLWLYGYGLGPELTPDTIAIGDTIGSETLYPLGDVDRYVFFGGKGDHFSLEVQGLGPPGSGGFGAFLTDLSGPQHLSYSVGASNSGDSLGAYQTNRIDLEYTGWYQVTIGGGGPPPRSNPSRYRFALTPRTTGPEVASGALAFGDSITGEAVDFPGDWDQYTLTGPAGQKMVVLGQTIGANGYPTLTIFDSTTADTSVHMLVQPIETISDTFTIPASGQLQVVVAQPRGYGDYNCFDPTCSGSLGITGGYRLVTLPFSAAPENVAAVFALGDTVRGEGIWPAGDVDEFTSSATPGDSLDLWFRLTVETSPPGASINMEAIDPGTGAVLAGAGVSPIGPFPYFVSTGSFVVPTSGNYVIRVRAYTPGTSPAVTAQYEFYVQRSP